MARPEPAMGRIVALQRAGQLQQACAAARQWASRKPNNPNAHAILGRLFAQTQRPLDAIRHLKRALALKPGLSTARHDLARVASMAGQHTLAISQLQRLIERAPTDLSLHRALAASALAIEDYSTAQHALEALLEQGPLEYELLIKLAECQRERSDEAAAASSCEQAIALASERPEAWLDLAAMHEESNALDAAAAVLERAQAQGVASPELSLLQAKLAFRQSHLDESEQHLQQLQLDALSSDTRRRALNLTGQVLDRQQREAEAFDAFVACGQWTRQQAPEESSNWYQRLVDQPAAVSAANTAPDPEHSPPWFLSGFPRSGTTLLDQFMAGHDQIVSLEEKSLLDRSIQAHAGDHAITSLPADSLIRHYWQSAGDELNRTDLPFARSGSQHLLDRMPINLIHLRLIRQLWPDAKMLVIHRHPADVCLSCLMQDFRLNALGRHFLDMDQTVRFYSEVMAGYLQQRQVSPEQLMEVRYEELIDDPEAVLRPVFDWLELPWQPGLLDHVSTARKRDIRTASYAQASRPIYQDARHRWQRYRQQLSPWLETLQEPIRQLGYGD